MLGLYRVQAETTVTAEQAVREEVRRRLGKPYATEVFFDGKTEHRKRFPVSVSVLDKLTLQDVEPALSSTMHAMGAVHAFLIEDQGNDLHGRSFRADQWSQYLQTPLDDFQAEKLNDVLQHLTHEWEQLVADYKTVDDEKERLLRGNKRLSRLVAQRPKRQAFAVFRDRVSELEGAVQEEEHRHKQLRDAEAKTHHEERAKLSRRVEDLEARIETMQKLDAWFQASDLVKNGNIICGIQSLDMRWTPAAKSGRFDRTITITTKCGDTLRNPSRGEGVLTCMRCLSA